MPPYQKLCFDSKATRAEQSKPGSCGYKQPFSLLHGSTSEVNAYMVAPGWFRMKRWPLSFSPLFLSLLPSFPPSCLSPFGLGHCSGVRGLVEHVDPRLGEGPGSCSRPASRVGVDADAGQVDSQQAVPGGAPRCGALCGEQHLPPGMFGGRRGRGQPRLPLGALLLLQVLPAL